MTVRIRSLRSTRAQRPRPLPWMVWLDVAAMLAWGLLLLKYWLTNKINVLLHPDYVWLAIAAGIALVALALLRTSQLIAVLTQRSKAVDNGGLQHITLLPSGWSNLLLLIAALVGFAFTPQPFASSVAMDRGVTDTLSMTRSQPQAFRGNVKPEDRSIIDWVRTLSVYPEPDAYGGQPARVDGFIIHAPELPDNYLLIARFVITCCAADVYPVGIPVKLPQGRSAYPPDQWFRIEGEMITETLNNQRQLVIQANTLTEIPEPENPYEY